MNATDVPARRSVQLGRTEIGYTLVFRRRKTLAISVDPDLSVTVVAPLRAEPGAVDLRVRAKGPWIVRQQLRFRDLHPLPTARAYRAGETHWYLGRQYRLKLLEGSGEGVRLNRPYLAVTTRRRSDAPRVGRVLESWLRDRSSFIFERQLGRMLDAHPSLRTDRLVLRVRRMSRRWGSCTRGGVITLNTELVTCSVSCIDYVIAHELCHLKVLNHGPRFYRLLARVMPDWAERRRRLNGHGL
jgi:predicted metal-dependent hydrolase